MMFQILDIIVLTMICEICLPTCVSNPSMLAQFVDDVSDAGENMARKIHGITCVSNPSMLAKFVDDVSDAGENMARTIHGIGIGLRILLKTRASTSCFAKGSTTL